MHPQVHLLLPLLSSTVLNEMFSIIVPEDKEPATRRSHKKSRGGCKTCKERKLKVDLLIHVASMSLCQSKCYSYHDFSVTKSNLPAATAKDVSSLSKSAIIATSRPVLLEAGRRVWSQSSGLAEKNLASLGMKGPRIEPQTDWSMKGNLLPHYQLPYVQNCWIHSEPILRLASLV